jgi:hypothetical protein
MSLSRQNSLIKEEKDQSDKENSFVEVYRVTQEDRF